MFPGAKDWAGSINQLVTSYLLHHGYHNTATVFSADTGVEMDRSLETAKTRRSIVEHMLQGQVDEALREAEVAFPHVLRADPTLMFRPVTHLIAV